MLSPLSSTFTCISTCFYFHSSLGIEFFKGSAGGRGRPGNAGSKGLKGAVVILFMLKRMLT